MKLLITGCLLVSFLFLVTIGLRAQDQKESPIGTHMTTPSEENFLVASDLVGSWMGCMKMPDERPEHGCGKFEYSTEFADGQNFSIYNADGTVWWRASRIQDTQYRTKGLEYSGGRPVADGAQPYLTEMATVMSFFTGAVEAPAVDYLAGTATREVAPAAAQAAAAQTVKVVGKQAARDVIDNLATSEAAKAAARRAVQRAGNSQSIEIITNEAEQVIVKVSRPGRNGYQVMEHTINRDGTKTVIQKAYDQSGKLVNYDPK